MATQRFAVVSENGAQLAGQSVAPAIHMVWTRQIDGQKMVGRLKVAHAVRDALVSGGFRISESIVRPLTATRSPARLARAVAGFLGAFARFRPPPLQCLLFGDPVEARDIVAGIPQDCDAVYLDGVRCLLVLEQIRRARPDIAIITDMDDLMSRRMALLLKLDQAPSTGYLKSSMPAIVEKLLHSRTVSRTVLRYEHKSLTGIEKRITALSDAVVLISGEDARVLNRAAPNGRVMGISMPAKVEKAASPLTGANLRFVFVGTDALRQNQLTIEAMIALWKRENIETPLVIYGEQQTQRDLPANVTTPGYAATIGEIYDGRSILLSPSYLAGGLKTKVLEAFANGTAVVGTEITFEGMNLDRDYPLLFDHEADMLAVLKNPQDHAEMFEKSARIGHAMIREFHDSDTIAQSWRTLFAETIRDNAV